MMDIDILEKMVLLKGSSRFDGVLSRVSLKYKDVSDVSPYNSF